MNRIIIYLFVLLASLPAGPALLAQPKKVPADSARITVRRLPATALQKYRDDEAFDYKQEQARGMGLWERFWLWVFRNMGWADSKGTSVVLRILLWGFCIFVLVYAILKFTGMNGVGLFTRDKKQELGYDVTEDDIYAIDFQAAIADAVSQKNYRLAIRLLYLQTLRRLADRDLIRWKLNKTNDVYAQELSGSQYHDGFARLTRAYDYAWYGDFSVHEELFADVQQYFQTFQRQLPA